MKYIVPIKRKIGLEDEWWEVTPARNAGIINDLLTGLMSCHS
jgi:hypothetical protein